MNRFHWLIALTIATHSLPGLSLAQSVTHEQFATGLARELGYGSTFLPAEQRPGALAGFLAGNREVELDANRFSSASPHIRLGTDPGPNGRALTAVRSPDAAGEVEYRFYVIRPGGVQVLARAGGGSQLWQLDDSPPARIEVGTGWSQVSSEAQWLSPGEHRLRVTLPPGGAISRIRIRIPCVPTILPVATGIDGQALDYGTKTTAMVRALDQEHMLPRADDDPISIPGTGFETEDLGVRVQLPLVDGRPGYIEAIDERAQVRFDVDVPQRGVYTLNAKMGGAGASSWDLNGCRVASFPAGKDYGRSFGEVRVSSFQLEKGEQRISVTLRQGVQLAELKLIRHRDAPGDYAAVADRLGLSERAPNEQVSERGLAENLGSPLLDERERELARMDRDRGGLPDGPPVALLPVPNDPPDSLPSDDVEEPYDEPASPYVPRP